MSDSTQGDERLFQVEFASPPIPAFADEADPSQLPAGDPVLRPLSPAVVDSKDKPSSPVDPPACTVSNVVDYKDRSFSLVDAPTCRASNVVDNKDKSFSSVDSPACTAPNAIDVNDKSFSLVDSPACRASNVVDSKDKPLFLVDSPTYDASKIWGWWGKVDSPWKCSRARSPEAEG